MVVFERLAVLLERLFDGDSFAGCAFLLYRGVSAAVTGVHASKASGQVIDPRDCFRRRGVSAPIRHWESQGKIKHVNLSAGCRG
jgi:hypothetical protein